MIVHYLDLKTGRKASESGISAFQLMENNWSCDCNRALAFGEYVEGCHCQAERFIVYDIDFEPGEDVNMTKEEIIAEANYEYYFRLSNNSK